MEFGPEIKVDGIRPEWLKDATKIVVNADSATDPGTVYGNYASGRGWKDIRTIRLPANHPHYNLITHTYTVRPEDEAALLASDPLSRSTPDERAVALVKKLAAIIPLTLNQSLLDGLREARAIVAALEPVDGDLIIARGIMADLHPDMDCRDLFVKHCMEGKHDTHDGVRAALAALARGRQLEKEGK